MAQIWRPALRIECPLRSGDVLGEALLRSSSAASHAPYINKQPVTTGTLKIGLVMLYNAVSCDPRKGGCDWGEELMQRVIRNRVRYCKKHGYIPIVATSDTIDSSRPAAWSKFLVIQQHLPNYDYLFYLDMDAVIMNMATPLEAFIEAAGACSDLVLTEDWNGPNTGAFLVKNSQWSMWFMSHAWELGLPLVPKKSQVGGISHPFEYEQRVVHYLLESNVWKKRALSKYRHEGATDYIRSHFSVLPQCAFNSYSLHPMDSRGLPGDVSRYTPGGGDGRSGSGDFVVHFAGKKGLIKTSLLEHYLNEEERESASASGSGSGYG